jgi:hypothetical protein
MARPRSALRRWRRRLIVLIALLGLLWFFGDRLVAWFAERAIGGALGTRTSIADLDLVLGEKGGVRVEGLDIRNPEGFSDGPLLAAGDIHLAWPAGGLFRLPMEVPLLSVRGVDLVIEQQLGETNCGRILDRWTGSRGEGASGRFVIRELRIENARIRVRAGAFGAAGTLVATEIPALVLHDLGAGPMGPVGLGEIAARVLEALLGRAVGLPDLLPAGLGGAIEQSLRKIAGPGRPAVTIPPLPGVPDLLDRAGRIFDRR